MSPTFNCMCEWCGEALAVVWFKASCYRVCKACERELDNYEPLTEADLNQGERRPREAR